MPVEISRLMKEIEPARTVLLFGAGSSIPSGAPSALSLQAHMHKVFDVPQAGYSLAEQTRIVENNIKDRQRLIRELQNLIGKVNPSGSILNLPLYNWKSIFTTNYDEVIEKAHTRKSRGLKVYTTNFDFTLTGDPSITELFKLHGTISKDISLGDRSRIIITEADYDATEEYREQLFDRLRSDIGSSHLIVIGHSLADVDIKDVVNRALSLRAKSGLPGKITLLLYTRDDGRASLFEARGVEVVFGSIDDFFAGMIGKAHAVTQVLPSADPLDTVVALRPLTTDVQHALSSQSSNASAMYNGWPATFGDISAGLTFRRQVSNKIVDVLSSSDKYIAILLGPSGVGKTTAARQVLTSMIERGFFAWQHKEDQPFFTSRWVEVARRLCGDRAQGVLLVDEAHAELRELNELVDSLHRESITSLKLLVVSTNHNWGPRVKSPLLNKSSAMFHLSRIGGEEIDRLLDLVERADSFGNLVESDFAGYSRFEKRRRLVQTCEADMFVCLKNIFSSEKLDDIILREYAELDPPLQEIYKNIAAMESAGVHVHRQLVVRLLGIRADMVGTILARLEDIIHEQPVDEKRGIYAWRGRHKVIMTIVAERKFFSESKRYDLFERIIENIHPTYDIEIRTIRELCNIDSDLVTIKNLKDQNILLRKLISIAPGERVPRHRLIRNLIEMGHFDSADTEIKIFHADFKVDAPTARYKINLATARAVRVKGLMHEDRIGLIERAAELAAGSAQKFKNVKGVLGAYCDVGIEYLRLTGKYDVYDRGISLLKDAEEQTGDADISHMINRFERRLSTAQTEQSSFDREDIIDE